MNVLLFLAYGLAAMGWLAFALAWRSRCTHKHAFDDHKHAVSDTLREAGIDQYEIDRRRAGVLFVLLPGWIENQYVGQQRLQQLYGLRPGQFEVCYGDERDLGKNFSGLYPLRVRKDNHYVRPHL